MADLRLKSNSGDRREYKTPKPYDYAQAVIETAPIHSGNVAGDTSRLVKSSKIVTRGQGTQRNPTRGEEAQRNLTRGKGTRENIRRGKPTRKKGAGERDATRKGTAETRRSGREDNGAVGFNNPVPNLDPDLDPNFDPNFDPKLDPNLDPNLDHNLDPNLQHIEGPTGNWRYRAAPNANDEPGLPQGTGWQDTEDIEDGNRPLKNPNHDDDRVIEEPPISENENEHNNDDSQPEGGEQPFERPMMTKKVISSQSRGKTKNYDETLQYQNSDGLWVPAVYHESIRLDLIHKASLIGKYVHERGSSTTPGDITSYLESQRTWGIERGGEYGPNYHKGNWPPILYQLRKPGNFSKSDYPEAEIWKYNGKIVLSVHDSLPLRKYENLPDTISSKISGAELEALLRSDPRVEARDIKGRMPMYYITETGKRILSFTPSTFSMRTHRFRAKHALLCWRERAGSSTTNDLILNYLKEHEPQAFQEGDVEGIGPIPKALEDAILGSNKANPAVINRAGRKYALDDKTRPKIAPAPKTRVRDNRSRPPHAKGRTIANREQGPLERKPTTMQDKLPQSAAHSPGHPPPASGPAREGPKMKPTQGRARPQRPEQQPPPEGPRMKNTHGRAPSESPERQPPLKRPRMENTQQRAPPRSPEQSLALSRPLTHGHENDAPTSEYVPPPRPETRKDLRKNQATSLTHQSDERRGEREREGPAQNPRRIQTRSQQAVRSVSLTAEQQPLPAPRPSRGVPGINPPMSVPEPQPEQQQQQRQRQKQAGNRPPPKHLPKKE